LLSDSQIWIERGFRVWSCNGVDASRSRHAGEGESSSRVRYQFGIPAQAPVLLFVGRLTSDKGIPELVRAFLKLGNQFPISICSWRDASRTKIPFPSILEKVLETHPRVVFAGPVQDIATYYAIADVVVLPSHREGLPTVILEAQAAGKPVVERR